MEIPRQVTFREILEERYISLWMQLHDRALGVVRKDLEKQALSCEELQLVYSVATTWFICAQQKEVYIEKLKKDEQERIDEIIKQEQVRKELSNG